MWPQYRTSSWCSRFSPQRVPRYCLPRSEAVEYGLHSVTSPAAEPRDQAIQPLSATYSYAYNAQGKPYLYEVRIEDLLGDSYKPNLASRDRILEALKLVFSKQKLEIAFVEENYPPY